ncbi:hypothetical protein Q4E40_11840 [Pontibacter sp. BT731]|uniref:hypothetical protein n=1 Tax=Pontibacter coccineus TaxID=3063328 RepID=UPI0026E37565|nr:hypothetical protein [Pontibacter sp. BT731]MDO6390822.1 hypothetical protein [Pontibacter sp. BT731]
MKIVCFIGSGFNNMAAGIVKSQNIYTKEGIPLHEEISRLNRLWGHLDLLLSPFNNIITTKHGEELLEAVVGIQKAYNKFIGRGDDSPIDAAEFSARIKGRMQEVGEQFIKFEASGGYSYIHNALPNLGRSIQYLLKNRVENLYLCTTNYDGIIDSLFTYYCKDESKRKFILKDGFIHGRFDDWLFRKANCKIAHLHGSYRYFRDIDSTRKLDKGVANHNPVMIYDDPNCKEAAIIEDPVLSANFLELERQLKVCDKVITIGNSFKTEPHLKRLLRTHFNRPNTQLVVCSNKPSEVASVLETCYDYQISQYSTEHVKSEKDLIKLFDQLLISAGENWLATA